VSLKPLNHVHIIGTGLMGTSIALAAKKANIKVTLEDNSASNLAIARALVGGDDRFKNELVDLVFVCVSPKETANTVARALQVFETATVTEITSVKKPVFSELAELDIDLTRFVSSHPMTGSEKSGPWGADPNIFLGKPWLVINETDQSKNGELTSFINLIGAHVEYVPVEEHDSLMARVSHLPQLLATILAQQVEETEQNLTGRGFREMTRLAGSDPKLWVEIIQNNQLGILESLQNFQTDLAKVIKAIESDSDELESIFVAGNNASIKADGFSGALTKVRAEIIDDENFLAEFIISLKESGVVIDLKMIEGLNSHLMAEIVLPEEEAILLTQASNDARVRWLD